MTIASLLEDGYRIYREPPLDNVDCPALRRIDDHARHLQRLLEVVSVACRNPLASPETFAREWARVQQWLGMAAGLRFVNVERLDDDGSIWMCGEAARYNDAHNDLASAYATEQTRLQYVWSGIERLLEILHLPVIPNKKAHRRYNRASLLLTKGVSVTELPEHYGCVLRHLHSHAARDPGLSTDGALRQAFEETPWQSSSGMLLTAGNALRNIPAHGDANVPEPADWDHKECEAGRVLPPVLHAPRLGTRGLLLSLQMLMQVASDSSVSNTWNMPVLGWWVRAPHRPWLRDHEPSLQDLLAIAHLKPPSDDNVRDDEDEDEAE